jgi:hypothetical protein
MMLLLLVSGGGCGKSASDGGPPQSLIPPHRSLISNLSPTVAQLHWVGLEQIGRETNAANFLSVWNLPESRQLTAQTLDKLALALGGGSQATNLTNPQSPVTNPRSPVTNYQSLVTSHPVAARLRPLLEDVLEAESYVELRQATNQPGELALAIRLEAPRAGLWTSNLTAALGSMTNAQSLPAPANGWAWRLPLASPLSRLDLARAGEWTLLGVAAETNGLLAELSRRISAGHTPAAGSEAAAPGDGRAPAATNYWLEADVDLGRLGSALGLERAWPAGLPRLAVTVSGVGGEVRTAGELKFAQPLPFEEAAWNIPTNLVYQNLISFTAVRGFRPWLESQKVWQELGLGAAPNQVFFWARQGLPFLSYGAAPLADASNCVARLTERLVNEGNAWMTTNGMGRFLRAEKTNGLALSVPFIAPYLETAKVGGSDYVLGGLLQQKPGTNSPAPPALFREVTSRTNLVAYDWELTGPRLAAWLDTGQLFRLLFFRNRLRPECASVKWFNAAAPWLGNCATAVMRTGPDELSFARRSAIGLTSVELHLLADWLESPQFPRGFNSQVVHRPMPPAKTRAGTNSVAPPRGP